MNPVFLSDSIWLHFGTSSVTTGAATNADSTPTVTVAEDGVDMGFVPTVTNVAAGLYNVQIDATSANGFEAGKRYSAYAVATVGAVVGRDGIGEFEVLATDLNTALDAAITTRMATYAQPTGFLAATFPAGTVANTTNITAGTITTTTNLTNLPAITADWLTAAGIAAGALNGKGDWNIGKTGYSLTQTFPANFGSIVITVGGIVSSNVKQVNDTTVNGVGTAGDPWGP